MQLQWLFWVEPRDRGTSAALGPAWRLFSCPKGSSTGSSRRFALVKASLEIMAKRKRHANMSSFETRNSLNQSIRLYYFCTTPL